MRRSQHLVAWRASVVTIVLTLAPTPAGGEWQVKPFLGVSFGGETTMIDWELAAGVPNVLVGVSGLLLGDVFGIEGDFGLAPGFFDAEGPRSVGDVIAGVDTGADLVLRSLVSTYTANVVVAVPRRLTEYSLRPYFVGGAGVMRVSVTEGSELTGRNLGLYVGVSPISMAAVDIGGGVTGFLTERVGVSWDVRWFRSLNGQEGRALSLSGQEKLSFWRANMALALRY